MDPIYVLGAKVPDHGSLNGPNAYNRVGCAPGVENGFEVGTRVVKQNSQPGDGHPDGSTGTILGDFGIIGIEGARSLQSKGVSDATPDEHFYFVEWDDFVGIPVGTRGKKLRPMDPPHPARL